MKELSMDTHIQFTQFWSADIDVQHSSNKDHVNAPCRLFTHSTNILTQRIHNLVIVNIKVQHQQLGFLGAVSAADGTHKFTIATADPPHNTATTSTVKSNEVSQKFTGPQVPNLDRSIVGRCHNEASVELETRNGTLVFVGAYTFKQTSALLLVMKNSMCTSHVSPCP